MEPRGVSSGGFSALPGIDVVPLTKTSVTASVRSTGEMPILECGPCMHRKYFAACTSTGRAQDGAAGDRGGILS